MTIAVLQREREREKEQREKITFQSEHKYPVGDLLTK